MGFTIGGEKVSGRVFSNYSTNCLDEFVDYEHNLKVLDYWGRIATVGKRQKEIKVNVRESHDERGVARWTVFDPNQGTKLRIFNCVLAERVQLSPSLLA